MRREDRVTELVDAATAGLRDDAELRLDVRAELLSHIQDKAEALRAGGKSEEESVELAMKSFGPATDITGALIEANRRRMKLRALARLAIRAALIPAAVAAALVVFYGRADRYPTTVRVFQHLAGRAGRSEEPHPDHAKLSLVDPWSRDIEIRYNRLAEEQRFLFQGDPERPSLSAQQRAIWEAHPESKVYYGNYIRCLAAECGGEDMELFEREIRRGEELDPDNAHYNYLLAGMLAERASELDVYREEGKTRASRKLVIEDRALLDRAMKELLRAGSKPYLKSYGREILQERLALVPPAGRLEDQRAKIGLVAGWLMRYLSAYRYLAHVGGLYAEILVDEGRTVEAEALLESWYPLVKEATEDSFTYIELIVVDEAIPSIVEEKWAAVYEKLGRPDKAEETRRRARRIREPGETRRKEAKIASESQALQMELRQSGAIHARAFGLCGYYPPDRAILERGRRLEHTLLEEVGVSFLSLLLILMMFGALTAMLRWRLLPGASSAPILLLPSWERMARILGFAVLLPLFAFYVYTRWSGLAGREYSVNFLWPRFLLELILLVLTILALSVSMATQAVRERCRDLGLPVPERFSKRWRLVCWIALGTFWALCLFIRGQAGSWPGVVTAAIVLCFLLLYGLFAFVRLAGGPVKHGLFYGTVARSLIPIFAAAAIVIGAVAHPYLTELEATLVRSDPFLAVDSDVPTVNKLEADLVRKLKAEMRDAFAEIDAGKKDASPSEEPDARASSEARTK